jgi:hypothetical protein
MLLVPTFETFFHDNYIKSINDSVLMACCTVTIVLAITFSYKKWFENQEASGLLKIGLAF